MQCLPCCSWAFLVSAKWGLLSRRYAWTPHFGGLLLRSTGSSAHRPLWLSHTGSAVPWLLCRSGGSPCPCTSWWILDHWTTREIQNRTFFNLFKLRKKVTKSKHEALRACSSDHPPASSPFILFH